MQISAVKFNGKIPIDFNNLLRIQGSLSSSTSNTFTTVSSKES